MKLGTPFRTVRATRTVVFTAILAVVVAVTGFEASAHGHLPATDGWHDATPHGTTARDEGLNSCSICRLAHETSSGPVAPGTVSEPLRLIESPSGDRSVPVLVLVAREYSPRAPPCPASC
jgi:hypothetical protein